MYCAKHVSLRRLQRNGGKESCLIDFMVWIAMRQTHSQTVCATHHHFVSAGLESSNNSCGKHDLDSQHFFWFCFVSPCFLTKEYADAGDDAHKVELITVKSAAVSMSTFIPLLVMQICIRIVALLIAALEFRRTATEGRPNPIIFARGGPSATIPASLFLEPSVRQRRLCWSAAASVFFCTPSGHPVRCRRSSTAAACG